MSNRATDSEKKAAYQSFVEETKKAFDALNFYAPTYFEKLGDSENRDDFVDAIKSKYPGAATNNPIILIPKYGVFEERLGNAFFWIFGAFGIGALLVLICLIPGHIKPQIYGKGNQAILF